MLQALRRLFSGKAPTSSQPGGFFGLLQNPTLSGITVNADSALKSAAVFAAVRVLSEDVAKIPVELKQRRANGGADVVKNHPVARVLRQPNSWQTSYEFRQMLQMNLALRGNAFAVIIRNGRGDVAQLIPVQANQVTVHSALDGTLFYQIGKQDIHMQAVLEGVPFMVPQEDVVHLRWMTRDGICGISPITFMAEAIGLSLAAEQHGAASFGNRATPGGVLEHPQKLSDEAVARLRQQWKEKHQGPKNAAAPAILEEGMKFQALEINNEDRQFLETRRFQVEEVARAFRLPPHMIGDLSRSTFSNIEQQSLDYVTNSLMSWLELWEAALDRDLFRQAERDNGLFVEFDVNRLLRGNIKDRFDAWRTAREWGWMSVNDIRKREGMNPVGPEGDTLLQPLNMTVLGDTPSEEERGAQARLTRIRQLIEQPEEHGDAD